MCLTALALGQSDAWPLLLASNRDEYFARPTLALARWTTPAGTTVVSGRDLEAGGTWLGITPAGRLAVLTNVREPQQRPGLRSRGELALAWLESLEDAPTFLARLQPEAYSGFNLLFGDARTGQWHWVSNRQAEAGTVTGGWQHRRLVPGLYGLSNAFLDTPWPKTPALKAAMRSALHQSDPAPALWQALADATPSPDEHLPCTGVAHETERRLSSAFVRFPDGRYGTRACTLVLARPGAEGLELMLHEKTWLADGRTQLQQEHLAWPAMRAVARSD